MREPEHRADEPIERDVRGLFLQDLDMVETLAEVQQHIQALIFGILDYNIKELPMRLQRHTIGIPNH